MGKCFPLDETDDDEVGLSRHSISNANMPHSVSPESRSQENGEDEVLPDAPTTSNGQDEEGTGVKLEDMFNGDDDEEYPTSSAPDNNKMEASSPPAVPE